MLILSKERDDMIPSPDGELEQLLGSLGVQVLKTVHSFKAVLQELMGRIFMRCDTGGNG